MPDENEINPLDEQFPTEEQPLGSEDPTVAGEGMPVPPIDDPSATQAEDPAATQADFEAELAAPQEPGTEAEGIEEPTAEVTQEAPLLEEIPEPIDEPPPVPAFPIDVKPKSDVYTLLLILIFCTFCTVIGLAGNEAYDHYDVQFYMFTKPNSMNQEPAPEEGELPPEEGGVPAPAGGAAPPPPAEGQ